MLAVVSALSASSPRVRLRLWAAAARGLRWLVDVVAWQLRSLSCSLMPWQWLQRSVHCQPVYLLAVSVFHAPPSWRVSSERFRVIAGGHFRLPPATVSFCSKILANSGLGENTAFPPGICDDPPHIGIADARAEAEVVLFSCLDQLFADCPTVSPCDVDVLIVNCSLFTPTPSLASLIINHYHMRQDIQSYQLGGMGCSAGVIGVHLARDLLQVYRAARCVVVSLEVITQSIHLGKDPAFLVSNALFRCGGSAQLYSNRQSDRLLPEQGLACRFSLQWTHRTHLGSDERAYRVVHQEEDAEGHKGVRLGRDLLAVAASAIRTHLHSIGYRLLSYTELSKVAACTALLTIARSASAHRKGGVATGQRLDGERDECAEGREGSGYPAAASSFAAASSTWWSWLRYSPSFSRPDLHACIHAGGRGVLDGIQRSLKLSEADLDVARRILHRHGNTSSSSVFYQLHLLDQQRDAHVHSGQGDERARKRLQRGDAVWLLAFGSGFKVNSALLEAL